MTEKYRVCLWSEGFEGTCKACLDWLVSNGIDGDLALSGLTAAKLTDEEFQNDEPYFDVKLIDHGAQKA